MKKILKKLKGKITVFALAMLAFQPVLGLAALPMKTFAGATDLRSVVINELAWAGSTASDSDEWIELYNTTSSNLNINGWKITGAGVADIALNGSIPANGYFLIANFNESDASSRLNVTPEIVNTSLTLYNSNGKYTLYDASNNIVDTADDGAGTPPAGDNTNKYSMERNATPGDGELATSWHTATTSVGFDAGATDKGTPKSVNSIVDVDAPIVNINNQTTNDTTPLITGTVNEVAAVITIQIDGGAPVVATNNGDGTWSYLVPSPLTEGVHEITATAIDGGGNIGNDSTANELIVDATAPVITLTGANPQVIEQGKAYVELGANVTDLDPAPVLTIDPSAVNTAVLGSYTVTYDAVDAARNSAAQVTRTVNVVSPVVDTPVVAGPTTPVVTAAIQEVPVDNQVYGSESYQGEVKADQEIKADDGSSTEEQKEEKPEDTKGDKNVPLWGIIFLLILAGIGGYLFYSQSPEKTSGK